MKAAVKAVLSGMIGIRRKGEHERQRVQPLQLIAAAVVLVALFIFTLLAIVRIATG
ncbi:MAG: DUF2970 domain-containing protein [Burkholderiales bacterium]